MGRLLPTLPAVSFLAAPSGFPAEGAFPVSRPPDFLILYVLPRVDVHHSSPHLWGLALFPVFLFMTAVVNFCAYKPLHMCSCSLCSQRWDCCPFVSSKPELADTSEGRGLRVVAGALPGGRERLPGLWDRLQHPSLFSTRRVEHLAASRVSAFSAGSRQERGSTRSHSASFSSLQEADKRILQALLEKEEETQREHSARREQARADVAWMQQVLEQQLQREREQEAELQMLLR